MYDFDLIEVALKQAGFSDVTRCEYQQGKTPDIEMLDVYPDVSLFVEATRLWQFLLNHFSNDLRDRYALSREVLSWIAARGGYIGTPDAFMERINPYKDHGLEITVRDEGLVIRKKPAWIYDAYFVMLCKERAKFIVTRKTISQYAAEFHMRYF